MTTTGSSTHAIPRFAHALDAALDRVLSSSAIFMTPAEKTDAIITLARVEARLTALKLRVIATASDACEAGAHRTVADLVSHHTREDRGRCAADTHLAQALERFTTVAEAMAAGIVSATKARIITDELTVLDADPDVSRELIDKAEQHLVSQAPEFTTRELRRLATKILTTIAPWIEDERERKRLEADEARAQRRLSLTFTTNPDGLAGVTEIRARIPDALAGRLRVYLEAFTAPRRLRNTTSNCLGTGTAWSDSAHGEHVPYHQRLGTAFCSLLETIDPERMPLHGGTATTIMITITLESLLNDLNAHGSTVGDLGAADLSAGSHGNARITAATARRLACTAGIIPVVLGTNSEILDMGRASRLFTPAQRCAMALRDQHCRAEHCTTPAAWCDAHHHQQPWNKGGKTDLANGKLLCPWHHHRAHDTRYQTNELPNGDIRYTRRR